MTFDEIYSALEAHFSLGLSYTDREQLNLFLEDVIADMRSSSVAAEIFEWRFGWPNDLPPRMQSEEECADFLDALEAFVDDHAR